MHKNALIQTLPAFAKRSPGISFDCRLIPWIRSRVAAAVGFELSGKDTTNFDNDTSGSHGVPFDTSPDLSGDQGRARGPHPEDTIQESTRSRGFKPQGHGADATQRDIPDETQPDVHSLSDGETQRDYSVDRTEQDIRTEKTAGHSGQITDQDIGAGQQKVWADPFAQENTSDEGGLGFKRQNPAFDKTAKSGAADFADTSGDTNWDALDKPRAGSSGLPSHSASMIPQSNPKKSPVGQTFANKYEIVGQIGQGGMGIVYKANDMILARTVAIKVIKANSQVKVEDISRFQLEAKSIAKLDHPNIIRVYEMSVTTDGDPYFVLEYIAGNSLSNEIRGRKGLPLDETIAIVEQVCDALNHAHESGVIHRDLKPSNIMLVKLRDRVVVKLLDFGIAKHFAVDDATLQLLQLTRPGQAFGSPHYMSPEQSRGQADSPASDIYSLGCMFFEMITGHPPFSGDNVLTTMNMHQTEEIPSVGDAVDEKFRAEVDQIIARMMAKRPEDRYLSVMDVKGDLLELQRKMKPPEISELAPAPSVSNVVYEVGDKRPGKNRTKIFASLVAVLIVGAVGIFSAGVIRGVKPSPPDVKDLTPWKAYDLKGQQLFDKGAYKPALLNFQKAYERAKLETDGPGKATKLNTSLRELRSLYFVMEDKNALDEVAQQLLDLPPSPAHRENSNSEALIRRIDRLNIETIDSQWNSVIEDVSVYLASQTLKLSGQSGISVVDSLDQKLRSFPDQQLRLDEVEVLRAYLDSISNSRTEESLRTERKKIWERLLAHQSELTPLLSILLLRQFYDTGSVEPEVLLKMTDQASKSENVQIRQMALEQKSTFLWMLGRKDAAIATLHELLALVESAPERDGFVLPRILFLAGYRQEQLGRGEVALPLLVRARAILKTSETFSADVATASPVLSLLDETESSIAAIYAGSGRFQQAVEIQSGVVGRLENSRQNGFPYGAALFRLGRIYYQSRKTEDAEATLRKSLLVLEGDKNQSKIRSQAIQSVKATLLQVEKSKKSPIN